MPNSFDLLDSRIASLAKARFSEPTEIQEKAIPLVLSGRNVLAIAPTGFGKTESVFLPVLSMLLKTLDSGKKNGIQFLYVTPLRALNRDMLERMEYWSHLLGVSIAVRHGDTKQSERLRQRAKPPLVMVTTPESINTMLISPGIRDALRNVKWVVVDEVHELVDTKRGVQLGLALERLRERVREGGAEDFQAIGLSATVGDERKAAEFISREAAQVARIDLRRKIELTVEFPRAPKNAGLPAMWKLDDASAGRMELLSKIIEQSQSTLIFVNTRSLAEALSALLFQIEELKGKVGVHHGSLSRETRIATEQEFKRKSAGGEASKLKAIVCTSSLELGIDIGRVDRVVQYHSPRQVTRLLQRVGRSGHRKNLVPSGTIVGVSNVDAAESAVMAKRAVEGKLEKSRLPENSLDVLAQQIAGIVLDKCADGVDKLSAQKVYESFKRALHYRSLTFQDFLLVCRQLSQQRLLAVSDGFEFIAPSRATKLYYYENLSTIPDLRRYFVKDAEKRRNVAMLDEEFVAEYLSPGATVIIRGVPWKVLSVVEDEVVVEQASDYSAAVPDWVGEEIPVAFDAAQELASLLEQCARGKTGKWELSRDYFCTQGAGDQIVDFAKRHSNFFLPQPKKMFLEESGKTLVLHTFAGNQANEALARAVSALVSSEIGESVRSRAGSYSIAFEFPRPYPAKKLEQKISELGFPGRLEKVLSSALPHSTLFRHKFVDVAKRFGLLRKDADLKRMSLRRLVEANAQTPVWHETMNEALGGKMDAALAGEVATWPLDLVGRETLSPISSEFLEFYGFKELLSPPEPTSQVLEAFIKNLLSQRVKLVCNYCLNVFGILLKEAPEKVRCPHCQSTQATLEEYGNVLAKSREGGVLKKGEAKLLADARRVESLINAYGGRALVALATYGIGAETAARVLSRLRDSEEEFYRDLLDSQKQFIATRKYWRA